jgi:pyruvate,water dikinase
LREHKTTSFLHEIQPEDYDRFGGKAANLARLHRAGFRIPQGFAIACDCFSQFLDDTPDAIKLIQQIEITQDIEDVLSLSLDLEILGNSYEIPRDLATEIENTFSELSDNLGVLDVGFSVRSSANVEDGKKVSFAGQAESFLCVRERDILNAVSKTWKSLLTTNSIMYLQTMGIPLSQVRMGVIVQEMINADISGVMFTANVVNNNLDQIIIESIWGIGEALVSGKATPDTYLLDKTPLTLTKKSLGYKEVYSAPSGSSDMGGTEFLTTPEERRALFTLDDDDLLRVANLGLEIEQKLGTYQDIEWSIQNGELVILQSRPITTLNQ